jgi:predicted transcriptional regulator
MISVRQMKAARALLAWSQGDLATASGISEPTIARLETAGRNKRSALRRKNNGATAMPDSEKCTSP